MADVSYVSRFVVDDEVGTRGCQLHEVRGDVAVISWFVPLAGRDYPVGAGTAAYRAAQEERHEVAVSELYETLELARAAAVARKTEVRRTCPM